MFYKPKPNGLLCLKWACMRVFVINQSYHFFLQFQNSSGLTKETVLGICIINEDYAAATAQHEKFRLFGLVKLAKLIKDIH